MTRRGRTRDDSRTAGYGRRISRISLEGQSGKPWTSSSTISAGQPGSHQPPCQLRARGRAAGHQAAVALFGSAWMDQKAAQRPSHTAEGHASGPAPGRRANRPAAETNAGGRALGPRPAGGVLEERSSPPRRGSRRAACGRCPGDIPLMARPSSSERRRHRPRSRAKPPPRAPRASWSGGRRRGPPGHSSQPAAAGSSRKASTCKQALGSLATDPTRVNLHRLGRSGQQRRHHRGREICPCSQSAHGGDRQTAARSHNSDRTEQHRALQSPGQGRPVADGAISWQHSGSNQGLAEVGIVPIAEADHQPGGAAASSSGMPDPSARPLPDEAAAANSGSAANQIQ